MSESKSICKEPELYLPKQDTPKGNEARDDNSWPRFARDPLGFLQSQTHFEEEERMFWTEIKTKANIHKLLDNTVIKILEMDSYRAD